MLDRHADDPFFQVLVLRGTLIVRRNGFLADLDELARDACEIADALQPPPRPWTRARSPTRCRRRIRHHPEVTPGWPDGYAQLAARLRLTQEDADDYHRVFPHSAFRAAPSRSCAASSRRVCTAGWSTPPSATSGPPNGHAAPCCSPAGRPPTPPGGERHPDLLLVREQRDGVAVFWSLRTAGFYREEQEDLIARALRLAKHPRSDA